MIVNLAAGGWTAKLLPDHGASFAALTCDGHNVLEPVPDGADPNTAMAGAFWMAPWTNRLDEGRLGDLHSYPLNRLVERTAIHGTLRDRPWQVVMAAPAAARLAVEDPTLPLACRAVLDVTLTDAGLALGLTLTSLSATILPFGIGWHPWFVRPIGTEVGFRATHRFERDERCLPIAVEPSTGLDGGEEAWRGQDTHWAGWDGVAGLDLGGLRVAMLATGAWARNLQLFASPLKDVICVEPVSHVPDVINRPRFAGLGDMQWLAPGAAMTGGVTLLRA